MPDFPETPIRSNIEVILKYPREKAYKALRDRTAYVYLTGAYPSHLRGMSNEWLRCISTFARSPTAPCGPIRILDPVAERLNLEVHPMVAKVREKIRGGYRIVLSRDGNGRRPYTKIFLARESDKMTVGIDGSILDHW